jgi:hypothetical protein
MDRESVYRIAVPANVHCLRCQKLFRSPDRAGIRICGRCKKGGERCGRLAERPAARCDFGSS